MLGSAIPRRWVVSLALVGLVSLFMASYSAVWANPASATTGTVAYSDADRLAGVIALDIEGADSGGPTPDVTVAPGSLTHWDWGPQSVSQKAAGTSKAFSEMPDITFDIMNSNSSCVTVLDDHDGDAFFAYWGKDIQASSTGGCSATLTVTLRQNWLNPHTDSFVVTVNEVDKNATSSTAPIDPTTVQDFSGRIIKPVFDSDTSVITITPKNGGKLTVPATGGGSISLDVQGGSVDSGEGAQVSIKPITDTTTLPPPPVAAAEGSASGTFKFGSSVVQITWYDDKGTATASGSKTLNRSAKLCMTATKAEADAAHGGSDGLGIWRHNGTEWVKLNSTVTFDAATQTYKVCANSSRFSPFALGLDVAPPAADGGETGLPVTGGYSPNALTLIMALFAGFALVGTGLVAARRSRRASENS